MVTGVIVGSLLAVAPGGAATPRFAFFGFTASQTTVYKAGGTITLTASVAAPSCTFSANKPIN